MNAISFYQTLQPLLAGAKCVTRRYWKERFARQFKAGNVVSALDKGFRNGGTIQTIIRLTADPFQESTASMTEQDFIDEGLAWYEAHPDKLPKTCPKNMPQIMAGQDMRQVFEDWKAKADTVWVVRFETLSKKFILINHLVTS